MATYAELEKSLEGLAPKEIVNRLRKVFEEQIAASIERSLTTSRGRVTGLVDSGGQIVKKAITDFVKTKAYKDGLTALLRNVNDVPAVKAGIYKKAGLNISVSSVTSAQKLAINEFMDAMNEDGLNARFNQILRTSIYASVKEGLSQADLVKKINESMVRGNTPILESHVTDIARTAADSYSKAIDQEVLDKYKDRVTHIRVVGSLIDSSSPQCRQAVEKYDREIPMDKINEWIAFAKKHGGNPDLTINNLPTLGGHYGCRHQWIPIIKN